MKYCCRPGIVMEKICGLYLLIPTLEAFDYCPNVIRMSLPAAMIWKLISKNRSEDDMIRVFQILSKKPAEEVKNNIYAILDYLHEKGVLIIEETDEKN